MISKTNCFKPILIVVILFLLAIRIFALFYIENVNSPQIWEQEILANNLLEGKGFYYPNFNTEYRSTAMVLYSVLCATIYYFTGHSYLAVKILQILISLFTCFLLYKISSKLFGDKIGIIAFILGLSHPALIVYSVKLHPLTLDIFLFVTSVYFLMFVIEGQKIIKNSFLAGLSLGAALLTRPTIGLFIPVIFTIFLKMIKPFRNVLRIVFYLTIGIAIAVTPLIVRNYFVFNRVVILPNDSGVNFWKGNNPYATGTANTLEGKSVLFSASDDFMKELEELDEFGQKELFYRDAWNFIKNNPLRAFKLFVRKLYYFWWFSPMQGLTYSKNWFIIYKLYYSIILLFAFLGFFIHTRQIPQIKKLIAYTIFSFIITISFAQSLYYVDGRHRWAIEALILIFSAAGISYIWGKLWSLAVNYKKGAKNGDY